MYGYVTDGYMTMVLLYAGEKAQASQFDWLAVTFDLAAIQRGNLDAQ